MCPDITMCEGKDCPHKETCYRFTVKPSKYQSYFVDPPIKDGKCDHYMGPNSELVWNVEPENK